MSCNHATIIDRRVCLCLHAGLQYDRCMTRTYRIARWISRLGHPFVLPLAALLIVTLQVVPLRQALTIVGLTAATITLPVLLFTRREVRRARWSDYDVSVRRDRYRLYPLILLVCGISGLTFWLVGAPAFMLRGIAAGTALAFVAMIANFVLKVSLHVALATLCALVILALNAPLGVAACIFAVLIAWSRVALCRHTPLEVLCGALLGGATGVILMLGR